VEFPLALTNHEAISGLGDVMTSILGKIGIENINSNLATAIRTIVVLVMAWAIVFVTEGSNDHKNNYWRCIDYSRYICIDILMIGTIKVYQMFIVICHFVSFFVTVYQG
jgi:uncharacterized membrane protein